jgi:signal transduction histidine kinase
MHKCEGDALESVKTAHELARNLLSEVRTLVSVERRDDTIDLHKAIEALCAGVPTPRIVLKADIESVMAPPVANAIFRSVQEAISNAVRHAKASTLHISLLKYDDGISVDIRDDGAGTDRTPTGNGLHGMKERIEELGGQLIAGNLERGGFGIRIWLPLLTRRMA